MNRTYPTEAAKTQMPLFDFFAADVATDLSLPFVAGGIAAGFPSPAADYMDLSIDLNRELVEHPNSTFYARVRGNSMQDAGIHDGDVLVVDKSLAARNQDIAVVFLNGEFTIKRLLFEGKTCSLLPANRDFPKIAVTESDDFRVWGIVTYIIKNAREGNQNRW